MSEVPDSLEEQYTEMLSLAQDALIKAEVLLATALAVDIDRELGTFAIEVVSDLKRVRNHINKKINN